MIWPQLLVQENKRITYYLHTQYLPWSDADSIAVSLSTTPLYSSQNPFSFPQILKVHLTAKEKNHSRIFDWWNCVKSEGKADHGKWLRIYFLWSWQNIDNIKFISLTIFVCSPVASSTLTLLCSHPQHLSPELSPNWDFCPHEALTACPLPHFWLPPSTLSVDVTPLGTSYKWNHTTLDVSIFETF